MGVFAASVAAFGASPTIGLYGMSQWFANNVARSGSAAEARTSLGINSGAEVDVKSDYGAVGDGVADDSTPFVNALAGVTDGGTINVPAGTYLVNTNVLYLEGKSVRIRGVPGKSIIKNPNATTSFGTIGFSTWGRFGATSTLLSVPVYQNRQTRTIPVVSSSGFSVGQYVWLHDNQALTNWNSISQVNKQIMRIESISGNNITFDRAPVKTFLPQYGARMVNMNIGPTQLIVEGIVMDGYGFRVDGAHDCVFRDVDIINTDSGNMFGLYYCSDVLISHCSSKSSPTKTPPSVAYGFSINGGENITVEDSTFTSVEGCNVIYPCYGVRIMHNTFINITDMNLHGNGERETWVVDNMFVNCFLSISAASNMGTQNTHVIGNKFAGSSGSNGRISSSPGSAQSPTVTANNGLSYNSNGGIWHGMPVMFWGTLPNEIIAYTNYFLLQPGASATNVCFSASKPKPPVAVTFDSTPGNWTVSASGFTHQDVMTFDAGTVPTGLTAGRYYYLAQKTGGVWYLSPAYDLSNPTWDTSADTVTLTSGVWNDGDAIHFESYGTPPTGISKGTLYYLKLVSGSTFNLALTPGGATIDMTGSASGGFYTCTAFSTDGANAWAAIGTPVKGLTGTLGSISMFPISYGATIENNDITDIQAEGIQLARFGNVLISGNRIGPHGWTINKPIAFNLQECVGVQVTGNRVALNISGSYIAKLANSRNMLFQGNYFSSPSSATVPAFGIGTSTTNYGLKIIGNEFPNHASRETVINTNTVRPAICGGGLMRGNIYAGRAEQGSASSLSASALSVVPGTVPQYQVVSSSLGSTIYQVLNDNAVVPGDEITIARSAAGAGDVVMQLQSNTNTTVCNLTSGTYGFVRLAFDPSTWGWLKVEGATNTVGMP